MLRTASVVLLLTCGLPAAWGQAPPARPTFDVASVKPSADGGGAVKLKAAMDMIQSAMPAGAIQRRGNNVSLRDRSLANLIATAYRVKVTQVVGPSWLADQVFDVDARIPEGASPDLANEMLQSLLEERFGLQLHQETRQVSGYDLVVGKNGPKLTVALPRDTAGTPPVSPDDAVKTALENKLRKQALSGAGSRRSSSSHATSAQIADMVSRLAQYPVVDKTGLQGEYVVELEISADTPDQPGVSIFEAVDKLGLKLVPRKEAVETLVVDRVSKTPIPN